MKSIADFIIKIAVPFTRTLDNKGIDLFIEYLDKASLKDLIKDLENGKTVYIPKDFISGMKPLDLRAVSKKDYSEEDFKKLINISLKKSVNFLREKDILRYDKATRKYDLSEKSQ